MTPTSLFVRRLLASALVLATATAQVRVWVVAPTPGPGVDFTTISAAVTAAAPLDLILVRDGHYDEGLLRITKGVTLMGENPLGATFEGNLRIEQVPAGQTMLLAKLKIIGPLVPAYPPLEPTALKIWQCQGTVAAHGCRFVTGSIDRFYLNTFYWTGVIWAWRCPGIVLEDCEVPRVAFSRNALWFRECNVAISRGRYEAGDTTPFTGNGPMTGGQFELCSVFLQDVEMTGGDSTYIESPGGVALGLGLCTAWIKGPRPGTIRGGNSGGYVIRFQGGLGLASSQSTVYLDGMPFQGGNGTPTTPPGDAGDPIRSDRPVINRRLAMLTRSPTGFPRGQTTNLQVAGGPAEPHWLIMSPNLQPWNLPPDQGNPFWLLQEPGWFVVTSFFTPSSGSVTVPIPVPMSPELIGQSVWVQDYAVMPGFDVVATPPIGGAVW